MGTNIANYFKGILGIGDKSRTPVYDWIRVLAVVLAIAVHVIGADLAPSQAELGDTLLYKNLNFVRWWCLNCNMVFIMLSGALLLPWREESVGTFYKKRFGKVAIPLVVYYLFYYFFFSSLGQVEKVPAATLIKNLLTANTYSVMANHFWVMYVTLGLYILFVFLRRMFKDFPYELLTGLVIVTIIISTIGTFVVLNVDLSWTYLGWILAAVAGYWVTRAESRKYDILLIVLGVAATVVMWLFYDYGQHINIPLSNLSPLRYLSCLGIFALFFKLKEHLRDFYLIRLISKYSYGMMLVHFWVISFLLRRICLVSSVMYKGVGCFVSIAVVLLASFLAAFVLDNSVVALINLVVSLSKKLKKH